MANNQDHFALEWIKSDLLETLNQARQALEAFAEGDRDVSQLRVCVTALHQIHGTLVMLELPRVTLFADHLEQLAQAMFDNRVKDYDSGAQTLMQGILELPGFLDEIQQGGSDTVQPVIPVINEARELLGLKPLAGGVRLTGSIDSDAEQRFIRIDGVGKAHKIRSAYQQVLLSILKGEDRQTAVNVLAKVAQGLYRICEDTPHAGQWQAFGEFVQSLARQSGPLDAGAVKLLRRADAEIRNLANDGLSSLQRPTNMEFVRHLLEAAESREYSSPALVDLKSAVDRDKGGSLSSSGRQALSSAADTLREELANIIDQIDLFVRAETMQPEQLAELLGPLKRIGSTLSLLGLESSRAVVFDNIAQLNTALESGEVEPQLFVALAAALAQVDENLTGLAQKQSPGDVERITNDAQATVAREARIGLDEIKQAIVNFVAAEWDTVQLAGNTERLRGICGALDVIPLPRAARLLVEGAQYLQYLEQGRVTPSWEQLDHFADAISGIDYYLERMAEESRFGRDEILDLAERSLNKLELPTFLEPEDAAALSSDELKDAAESASDQVEEILAELGEQLSIGSDDREGIATTESDDLVIELPDNMPDIDAELASWNTPRQHAAETRSEVDRGIVHDDVEPAPGDDDQAVDDRAAQAESEPELELEDSTDFDLDLLELDDQYESSEAQVPDPVQASEQEAVADQSMRSTPELPLGLVDTYDTDDEIVEIFGEEVDEVLQAVDVALPQWQAEPDQEFPLKELRRAFHTLKGSGRIVGANILGELSWSIENMLNRVLDHTVAMTPAFVTVVREARNLIPVLRDDYEAQREPKTDSVAELMERADLLSSGETLADAPVRHVETVLDETDTQELAAIDADESEQGSAVDVDSVSQQADIDDASADLQLFLEEAEIYMRVLQNSQFAPRTSLEEECLRAFHTLVGSAAMAGVDTIVELAQPAYDIAKTFHRQGGNPENAGDFVRYLNDAVDGLQNIFDAIKSGTEPEDHLQLIVEADRLLVLAQAHNDPTADLLKLDALGVLLDVPDYLTSWQSGSMDLAFSERLASALQTIEQHVKELQHPTLELLVDALFKAHERLSHLDLTDESYGRLRNAHERLLQAFDALASDQTLPDMQATLASLELLGAPTEEQPEESVEESFSLDLLNLEELLPEAGDAELRVSELPLPEQTDDATEADHATGESLIKPDADTESAEHLIELDLSSIDAVTPEDIASSVEDAWEQELEFSADADQKAGQEATQDSEDELVQESIAEAVGYADSGQIEEFSLDSLELGFTDTSESAESRSSDRNTGFAGEVPVNASPEPMEQNFVEPGLSDFNDNTRDEEGPGHDPVDLEILEVFFEEADEITDSLDTSINNWRNDPDNQIHRENLLRGLHTLKGGARMAGLTLLGDVTHQFESFLIQTQSANTMPGSAFFDDLVGQQDHLSHLLVALKENPTTQPPELQAAAEMQPQSDASPVVADDSATIAPAFVVPGRAAPAPLAEEAVGMPKPAEAAEARSASEIVRVGAGLLEALVNLAGESSIVRARIEQGVGDFTSALDEMEITIERLREQLRRLEIETEAQILSRHEHLDGPTYDNFDPLEMDRYSQLQQLSRGLTESASDMLDLKDTLLYKARESETLLMQQARINTELQEGLMRTRMVPFSRLLPRLRRMVRQTAKEVGKSIDFEAYNVDGELDRNLLERMIAPLEHMLRNSVDHGIESADLRRQFSKPEAGQIELRLTREGGDVMIEISDDGAGIDVESVRAKAVERGLMNADADLRDDEILQFVLAPGFTTAKSVTQISGRGVGLDVVHSEVKQLGGSINIVSRPGRGTRFILRVPFTVSVNRALMVSIGEDLYAIPLNTIEGIVLLGSSELEKLYEPGNATFQYAGASYDIKYLGHFLGREYRGNPQHQSAPVVLVRSGDRAVAVHVDAVQGSREIVVKSLGPQFAGLGGISGATILGDGSVVVILDLLALIRARPESLRADSAATHRADHRPRCVMVVDDSVTVRKVTSRLLERRGMEVLVAKDGVEAVALLQERRPDIMLLDIEMPRMDGFEVARQVRHDDLLKDLPIVMISSRTGEKHQEHAISIGVNRFLGKPFQENELLATIEDLVTIP